MNNWKLALCDVTKYTNMAPRQVLAVVSRMLKFSISAGGCERNAKSKKKTHTLAL